MSLFEELKRRNVFRVGIAWILMGWVVLQGADFVLDLVGAPDWVIRAMAVIGVAGLPIALFFAWAFEVTPEGIKREAEVDRSQSITPHTGRKLDRAIIVFLALAVVLLLGDRWYQSGAQNLPDPTPVKTTASAPEPAQKSIAVLPFANMSSDAEQEYFSDGITEEILNVLAGVDALKVAGRTSSFAFKGRNEDLRAIGETLGVEHILEGSVRKAGDRVRITAQLVQVADGFHLWSETYDRELTDIFAIQDDIANRILEALKTTLEVGPSTNLPSLEIIDYNKYLLARQLMRERREEPLQRARALFAEVNESAPDYAPAWAGRATAVLLLRDDLSAYGSIPTAEVLQLSKTFLDRARALDPDNAETLAALGLYYASAGMGAEAIEALQKALAINPNMSDASNWLWGTYWSSGRLREALALNEQIRERDPLYLPTASNITFDYLVLGKEDELAQHVETVKTLLTAISDRHVRGPETALALMRADYSRMVETYAAGDTSDALWNLVRSAALLTLGEPERAAEVGAGTPTEILALAVAGKAEESNMLANAMVAGGSGMQEAIRALVVTGRYNEAVRFFDQRWPSLASFEDQVNIWSLDNGATLGLLAEAFRASGDEARAELFIARHGEVLDIMEERGADNHWLRFSRAYHASLLGDGEQALAHLAEFAADGHFLLPDFTEQWQSFSFLRGDPRFEELLDGMTVRLNEERAELGLPAYQGALRG